MGPRLASFKARLSRPVPAVTYDDLWILFKPGHDAYYNEGQDRTEDFLAAGVIMGTEEERPSRSDRRNGKTDYLRVIIWGLEFNGIKISRDKSAVPIESYEGERQVMALPIYPSRFQDNKDGGKTRRDMEERGERLYKLVHAQPRQMWYDGNFFSLKKRKVRLLFHGQ